MVFISRWGSPPGSNSWPWCDRKRTAAEWTLRWDCYINCCLQLQKKAECRVSVICSLCSQTDITPLHLEQEVEMFVVMSSIFSQESWLLISDYDSVSWACCQNYQTQWPTAQKEMWLQQIFCCIGLNPRKFCSSIHCSLEIESVIGVWLQVQKVWMLQTTEKSAVRNRFLPCVSHCYI